MYLKRKSLLPLALLSLLVTLVLAACGDPTATPVPVTTAAPVATTAAATTAAPVATTAAATTAAATTVAATTVAPVATTARPATTAAVATSGGLTVSPITGATEVTLDQAVITELGKQIPGLSNPSVKMFVSDDDGEKLAAATDAALVKDGYKFGIPGQSAPSKQGDSVVGFYVKTGSPDVLMAAGAVPADASSVGSSLNISGLSADAAQKLTDQLKSKKSLVVLIGAPGLLQSLLGGGATAPTTAAATTVAAGSTTAAVATGGDVGEADVPIYAGAKRVDTVSGSIGGLTSVYYVSGEDYDKITGWAKKAFTDKGWSDVQTLESGGATVVTGKKGKFNLLGTIVGPKARGNASFDNVLKQANAGATDTVIAVVVTGS